ncbi:MAG: gliding motility-associated C-terminal domain-containing protein [Bacteroidia bacterium]
MKRSRHKSFLKHYQFLFLSIFWLGISLAQNQQNIWYFGDKAGLDFNSGVPVAVTNGQMFANEGCASICDNSGSLLFYTNGVDVWNKNHVIMPNGSGLTGNVSTTQAALIFPVPSNPSQYYIFTLASLAGSNGLRYSIVDMNLQNGAGDITITKNIALHNSCTEKMTAVQMCNGNVWVIIHEWNTNNFRVYPVTSAGVGPAIVSSVGTVHQGGSQPYFNSAGYLKVSKQCDRLALAIRDVSTVEVFDFNKTTGIVSNPLSLSSPGFNTLYGVEFSPDGSKLYVSSILGGSVFQYNLLAGSAASISASAVVVGTFTGYIAALQRAVDNKIYVAKEYSYTIGPSFIDVIDNPNLSGVACNYISNAVSLSGKSSLGGLPNFPLIDVSDTSSVTVAGDTVICAGESTVLTALGAQNYEWSDNLGNNAVVIVFPVNTTKYTVTSLGCGNDTAEITVNVDPLPDISIMAGDSSVCPGEQVSLIAVTSFPVQYQWSGGGSNQQVLLVNPYTATDYYITVTSAGCSNSDTIRITVAKPAYSDFEYEQIKVCESIIRFNNTSSGSDTSSTGCSWSFGDGSQSDSCNVTHNYDPGSYSVLLIENPNTACADSMLRIITVTETQPVVLNVPNIFTPNGDGINDELTISGFDNCIEFSVIIYNRWGQEVFSTDHPSVISWNGQNGAKKEIIEGVYYYLIEGSNFNYKGTVSLCR